jgi:hypothetical protein
VGGYVRDVGPAFEVVGDFRRRRDK